MSETDPTPPIVRWKFAQWDSETRDPNGAATEETLYSLRKHIQEVSGFVLESQGKGRTVKLQADYLAGLIEQKEKLEKQFEIKAAASKFKGRFGVSRFVRGGGP